MEFDKNKTIQLLELFGTEYVLIQKEKYDELLDKLEALDTTLDITRSRADASKDLLKVMLAGAFSAKEIREIAKAKTIGERIRRIREMREMGQRDLADKAGLSQTTISNLENNRVAAPSYAELEAIFTGLGVSEAAVFPVLKTFEPGD
ncbi:MAG: helix-turn-helix transcriptional regulator [Candidatus Acidiferrales bacterium]